MTVEVTKHATNRTKERIGLPKGSAEKNAQRALDLGVTHAETKGSLHRYLDGLYLRNPRGNNVRIYHRYVYIFKDSRLITVLPLPRKYNEVADRLQKERENSSECASNPNECEVDEL